MRSNLTPFHLAIPVHDLSAARDFYGRVLAGIQVPADESEELEAHLAALGYPHFEESGNPAYRMFLA